MATYVVIEKGKDATGLVLHDVKRDAEIVMTDIRYNEAFELVTSEIKPGDIYQECVGDSVPYCVQTYEAFQVSVELDRKFDAGEA